MNSIIEKRVYTRPQLECVKLDSEISLALESPPVGPDEVGLMSPAYFNNDPFKTNLG
jgi:hypothetical protein